MPYYYTYAYIEVVSVRVHVNIPCHGDYYYVTVSIYKCPRSPTETGDSLQDNIFM